MGPGMKLFTLLWLIMVTRAAAAGMTARTLLRMRSRTNNRWLYEWFTALGIGFGAYAASDLLGVWNSVVNGPQVAGLYTLWYLWQALAYELAQWAGIWLIYLVVTNGDDPGWVRSALFCVLTKLRLWNPPRRGTVSSAALPKLSDDVVVPQSPEQHKDTQ